MPDRRRGKGDKRKEGKRGLFRRRSESAHVERASEPVTRWFDTASLPGSDAVAPEPQSRTAASPPRERTNSAPRTQTTPQQTPRGSLPPEYRRVAEGRLPSDYPAAPQRGAAPAAATSRVASEAPRASTDRVSAPAAPRPTQAAPAPATQRKPQATRAPVAQRQPQAASAPVVQPRGNPRVTAAPAPPETFAPTRARRHRSATPSPPVAAAGKGRHRVKGKSWAPAPRRRRRASRGPWLRLPSSALLGRLGLVILAAAIAVGAVVGVRSLGSKGNTGEARAGAGVVQAPTTTLFVGTDIGGTRAVWLALLSYDPVQNQGAIVYVPAHTAVEIPGRGLQGMGDAVETGGLPLLLVSAESYFGIEIDNYLEVPRIGAEALFEQLGPMTVDVPGEVVLSEGSDTQRLLLSEGQQELGALQLADLLYTIGAEGDDVELGARHLAFWDALAERYGNSSSALQAAFATLEKDAGGEPSSKAKNSELVASLASLGGADLTLAILPVQQVSVGGAELYATDTEEISQFVSDTLPGVTVAADQARVQVLNGNGQPGIGQKVAEKLVGQGFRVVLSGNADSFKYNVTKVITYDSSPEGQQMAARARDLLGTGEVQVSGQGQGSVDLTIIVGKDFLRTP